MLTARCDCYRVGNALYTSWDRAIRVVTLTKLAVDAASPRPYFAVGDGEGVIVA